MNSKDGNRKERSKLLRRYATRKKALVACLICAWIMSCTNITLTKNVIFAPVSVNDSSMRATTPLTENDGLIFLNESDASSLLRLERNKQRDRSPYSIDVLVIGSKEQVDRAKVQRETWASHDAIRHFILSTEYDEVDPFCKDDADNFDVLSYTRTCRSSEYWRRLDSFNQVTDSFRKMYASGEWLSRTMKKKNPKGWLCVQRRFITSFTKLFQIYSETKSLPDYFILADDDTYVNIDHIIKMFMINPKLQQDKGLNQDMMMYPPMDVPVVTAGCRIRPRDSLLANTFPYGGYGIFFSRGSLERLIEPIHCERDGDDIIESGTYNDPSKQSCKKLLNKSYYSYPINATISEEKYYTMGDSLNQVFYKYSRNVDVPFCLHSDWVPGYLANFHNISRHTSTLGADFYDERFTDVQENRLHQMRESVASAFSIWAMRLEGECKFGETEECNAWSTVCHHMNVTGLRNIYRQSLSLPK